ncbi:MAG: voltage-gated sodium channel [Paraglaciecola sp.]|jgi:voltage-gated sodium channel
MSKATENTTSGMRGAILRRIEAPKTQYSIMLLIVINAVILGLETVPAAMQNYGSILLAADHFILGVFVIEILLRIYAHRLAFFRDPWSLFDFAVVGIALVPASGPLEVLRSLRILRVLRLLTLVPSMRRVVGALLGSIPGLSSIALVLLLIYYVFAVIATKLFAENFPQWFGSIGESLYTLFQIMTLESWSMGIVRPVMVEHPYAWIFFITFILIATFTMLNLFIAIIVNAMQTFTEQENREHKDALDETRAHIEADLHRELAELRGDIAELRQLLKSPPTPRE